MENTCYMCQARGCHKGVTGHTMELPVVVHTLYMRSSYYCTPPQPLTHSPPLGNDGAWYLAAAATVGPMSALIIIHSVYCQPRSNMSACLASKYTVSSINSVWSLDYKREILCNLHITHLSDECLVLFAANKIQS